jgi:DNA-binding NarL/FixJ family response regulator
MNSTPEPEIRVLIVDDDRGARQIVRQALKADPSVVIVGEGADGEEGLQLTRDLHPTVVVTDLDMPLMGGLDLITIISKQRPAPRLVMFSGTTANATVQDGFGRGAHAYVPKSSPGKLVEAVRLAAEGGFYFG